MANPTEPCTEARLDERLLDTDRRLIDLAEKYHELDRRHSETHGRVESIDDRLTKLAENESVQNHKLEEMERKNSKENAGILSEVRELKVTLQDHMQNGVELIHRQRATEISFASLESRFTSYVTENAELIEGVKTAQHALVELKKMVAGLAVDIKAALRTYLIRGAVAVAVLWTVYRFCPGLKPMLTFIMTGGALPE